MNRLDSHPPRPVLSNAASSGTPIVTEMAVIPVAGHDSMLFNLCGAHGPFFTRNVVILKDSSGRTGVGEVPGPPDTGEGQAAGGRAIDWSVQQHS